MTLAKKIEADFVGALQRADKFEIRDGVPDELPEFALGLLDDKSEGPARFNAAQWIGKFDAIVLMESPMRLSLAEIGLIASAHKRIALLYVTNTLTFWKRLIEEQNLMARTLGVGSVKQETMH